MRVSLKHVMNICKKQTDITPRAQPYCNACLFAARRRRGTRPPAQLQNARTSSVPSCPGKE